jgi:hypothetical protein
MLTTADPRTNPEVTVYVPDKLLVAATYYERLNNRKETLWRHLRSLQDAERLQRFFD